MQFLALAALMGTLAAAAPAPHNPEVVVYEKAAVKTEIVTVAGPGETFTPTTYQKDVSHEHHHHHDDQPAQSPSAPVNTPTTTPTYAPVAAKPTPTPSPSPSPSPSSSTGGTSSSGGGSAPGNMAAVLKAHNDYRAKHSAPPLTWSPEVASSAKASNDKIKCPSSLTHTDGPTLNSLGVGENLACGTGGAYSLQSFVDMWYNEIKEYNFGSGGFSEGTGHFTQLVWKSSTQLGCDYYNADGCAEPVLRCQYKSPGNYAGQYQQNVLAN